MGFFKYAKLFERHTEKWSHTHKAETHKADTIFLFLGLNLILTKKGLTLSDIISHW
jgi:hypothetical protein